VACSINHRSGSRQAAGKREFTIVFLEVPAAFSRESQWEWIEKGEHARFSHPELQNVYPLFGISVGGMTAHVHAGERDCSMPDSVLGTHHSVPSTRFDWHIDSSSCFFPQGLPRITLNAQ
jgi:hypothetical protein